MGSQKWANWRVFKQKYSPSTSAKRKDLMAKVKGPDSSWLPPSQAVLLQKYKRMNYDAAWWKQACEQKPLSDFNAGPIDCGWELKDGTYCIVWYVGDQLPADIANNLQSLASETDEDEGPLEYDSDEYDCDD